MTGVRSLCIDGDALIDFTAELVKIPSVNRPEDGLNELAAARLVARQMRAFGWEPLVQEAAPGRPNVIAIIDGGRPGPTLLFEGHTDVVTEGDRSAWNYDPYGAQIVDGRLYGRGSADMKGGVAAMLFATDAVARSGQFPGCIKVAALVDEEGMMIGAKSFVAQGHAEGVDGAIVCEPEAGEICTSQKGALRLRLFAKGKMAHGAMPGHGLNPINALSQCTVAFTRLEAELQERHGSHPHLGLPFITPTVLLGGEAAQMNVIPDRAEMAIDIRTIPGVNHRQLLTAMSDVAGGAAAESGVSIDMEVIDDRPPTETPPDAPIRYGSGGRARASQRRKGTLRRCPGHYRRDHPVARWGRAHRHLWPRRQMDRASGRRIRASAGGEASCRGVRACGSRVPRRLSAGTER